jgi:hypothetical protein
MSKEPRSHTYILLIQMPRNDCRQLDDCCLRGRAEEAHCEVAGIIRGGGVENTLRGCFPPLLNWSSHQKKNSRVSAVVDVLPVGFGCGFGFAFTSQFKHSFERKSSHE